MTRAEKIRPGLYRIVGQRCICGGELWADRCGPHNWLLWELYCRGCLDCDANGYATLRECVAAAGRWRKDVR